MAKARLATLLLVLAAVAGSFWWQHRRADEAERQLGLVAARTLDAVFERTSALQVARLSGNALAQSEATSGFVFRDVQRTRAPYTVDYTVDLRSLDRHDMHWDTEHRIMTVDAPEVTVGRPNLDMTRQEVGQRGLWVSRRADRALDRQAAVLLTGAVTRTASQPENLVKAQAAARSAIAKLVAAPLAAAGLGGVSVRVRLPGETRAAGLDAERWDESRPVAEVLRNDR